MCECICYLGDAYQHLVAGAKTTFYTGLNRAAGMRSGFDIWPVHVAYTATSFKDGKEGVYHVMGEARELV